MTTPSIRRAEKILEILIGHYGTRPWNWHTQQTPFQILIGTVLSQRTKDEMTDRAARVLFARFPTANALANATSEEVERLIRPVNYYKTKAARIIEISRVLISEHSGKTPSTVDELKKLPGVGIKTASCVVVYGFGKPAIPVDTHVHRIFNRIGLINTSSPERSETALWDVVPDKLILKVNELMVKHGQTICRPQKPLCYKCPIADLCGFEPKNGAYVRSTPPRS